jgi:hypothetical protein
MVEVVDVVVVKVVVDTKVVVVGIRRLGGGCVETRAPALYSRQLKPSPLQ